ncbi:MAG TPA: FG-GAP-like repeat-containing protein, partial [Thermoanaerobaculia bacterium]|nr:FG-GAP-like repeat-containing protein [Thermoanaerobaculia bacterium]
GVAGQEGEAVGALAFDYDNDGHTDLYVTYLRRANLLYHNRGDGTFEEVAKKAGVALNDSSTSAAAFDYDRDGNADLYVLVYGPPDRGPNIQADNAPPNHLFRNNGDGTFTDVSKSSRTDDTGWGLAVESADLDGDGWPDLYIANDFGSHTYFHNNGDGTFRNIAGKAGVRDPGFGMGVAVDDYNGDGRLDFYVSNYSFPFNWFLSDPRFPMPAFPYNLGRPLVWRRLKALSRGSSLFRSSADASGRFERTSEEAEVSDTSWSWGCVFVDANLDGRPDLFVVNGMVTGRNPKEREIDFWNLMSAEYKKFEKGIPTADFGEDSLWGHTPKRFYKNLDGRHFAELAAVTGLESDANQRGLVVLDVNGDGAPDLFATGFLQRPSLWVNRNPSHAKPLVVRLEGNPGAAGPYRSTREALGAIVTVEVAGVKRAQVVSAGYSFLSSGSRSLFFGLGDHDHADRVTVKWPSGRVSNLKDVPAGKLSLREPASDILGAKGAKRHALGGGPSPTAPRHAAVDRIPPRIEGGKNMNHRRIGILVASVGLAVATAAQAQEKKMEMPKAGPEQQKLSYFVGTWRSSGDVKENPMMPAGKMTSTDSCDWFHGGFFVVCHSTGTSPMGASHGLYILGYSTEKKAYTYYGVDSMGYAGQSNGTVDGSSWTYMGEEKMGEKIIHGRYSMTELSPTSYAFKYETSEDGQKWSLMMEGKSTKAEAPKTASPEKK